MHTLSNRRIAFSIAFIAIVALADASVAAWWFSSVWGMAASAGTTMGLIISIAWVLRRWPAAVSLGLLAIALAMAIALSLNTPRVGASAVVVAVAVFGAWFLIRDVWLTRRAHIASVSRRLRKQSLRKTA